MNRLPFDRFSFLMSLFLMCISISAPIHAGFKIPVIDSYCCEVDSYSSLYLGPEWYYSKIKIENGTSPLAESVALSSISKARGNMFGINMGYQYLKPCGLYANVDFTWALAELGGSNTANRYVHDYYLEGRLGYSVLRTCCKGGDITLIPYLGVILYYSDQDLQKNSPLQLTKGKNRYQNFYLPLGIWIDTKWCDDWNAGLRLAWLPSLDSSIKLTALKGARWDLENRYGYCIEFPIVYQRGCACWHIKIEPYYRRYFLGRSTAVSPTGTVLGLPKSSFIHVGLKAAAGLEF